MVSGTVDKDSQTMKNKWQAYITLPNKEITSVNYSDVIQNGTSKRILILMVNIMPFYLN